MRIEEPKIEFVPINLSDTVSTSGCKEDNFSNQGGGSCIGNQDHSHGEGCYDTAPLIAD